MAIIINGQRIDVSGSVSVVINNGKVMINGAEVPTRPDNGIVELRIAEGTVARIQSDASVRVDGPVHGPVAAGGNVATVGDIIGDVSAGGNITAQKVLGRLSAGGNIITFP